MALPDCILNGCLLVPPSLSGNTCAPAVQDGEVTDIFITDTAITAVGDLSSYDNTGGTGVVIRLKVTGELAEPEQGSQIAEGGVTIYNPNKVRTVNFEFYDDSSENYAAVRQFECGKPVIIYYKMGSYIYGGSVDFVDGVETVLRINQVGEGQGSFAKYIGTFSWAHQYAPNREVSPI